MVPAARAESTTAIGVTITAIRTHEVHKRRNSKRYYLSSVFGRSFTENVGRRGRSLDTALFPMNGIVYVCCLMRSLGLELRPAYERPSQQEKPHRQSEQLFGEGERAACDGSSFP